MRISELFFKASASLFVLFVALGLAAYFLEGSQKEILILLLVGSYVGFVIGIICWIWESKRNTRGQFFSSWLSSKLLGWRMRRSLGDQAEIAPDGNEEG